MLLDIILDAGVMPAIVQSDNEFLSLAFEELFMLLGTSQLFSTALRPQSQSIIERSHLAILVENYARSNPDDGPNSSDTLNTSFVIKQLLLASPHMRPFMAFLVLPVLEQPSRL